MAYLSIWCYQTPLAAKAGSTRLRRLEDRGALEVLDAVTVMWAPGAHVPRVMPVRQRFGSARWATSVLPALFEPLRDDAPCDVVDARLRDIAAVLEGSGVDAEFLQKAVGCLTPGYSVLAVLSGKVVLDDVRPVVERGLARGDAKLLHLELPDGGPEHFRRVLQFPDL
jgi:uncharacterized membrane protein